MGRIARLISFVRATAGNAKTSDVKVDSGGGDNRTAQHFSAPGDDSFPLPGDYVQLDSQAGTGRDSATGYLDPDNEQKANAGDKRIYARDANTGDEVVEVWLKNDGTAEVRNDEGVIILSPNGTISASNGSGSFTLSNSGSITGANNNGSFSLESGGDFVVNGAVIDTNGRFTDGDGLIFNIHTHDQDADSDGDSEQPVDAPRNP